MNRKSSNNLDYIKDQKIDFSPVMRKVPKIIPEEESKESLGEENE